MLRRPRLAAALIATLLGCPEDEATCPTGTKQLEGTCKVACSAATDCLSNEMCNLSLGICVGKVGGADAGTADSAVTPDSGGGTGTSTMTATPTWRSAPPLGTGRSATATAPARSRWCSAAS